ncbi:MAG: family 10 glycosylhydrolase [Bacteroidales bacterium]|nr:family 10 glycosylhydrolase [Bacteroidales bacterium]
MLKRFFIVAMALVVLACGKDPIEPEKPAKNDPNAFNSAVDKIVLTHEFRGVWLATVSGTDWPKTKGNAEAQKQELTDYIKAVASAGCNTVIFQVCSNMDALWPSKLLPWSSVLNGTEGVDPGYDPAELAVRTAHECGIEIHAWINPYRIGSTSKTHAALSPVKARKNLVKEYDKNYYLDPALPETHAFLGEIATELMTAYEFDGLHIDDYFYPSGYNKDQKGWETSTYPLYGGGKDREEWRFSNVDASVEALWKATHAARPEAVFGVSPRSRSDLYLPQYADPARWAKAGTVDYLVPQIYWTVERGDFAAFDTVLEHWNGLVGSVPVYVGIAAYKMEPSYYSQAKNGEFQYVDEFIKQIDICRNASWCKGHVWFRTESILKEELNLCVRQKIYAGRGSLVPEMGPDVASRPIPPVVSVSGSRLSWDAVQGASGGYAVFELVRRSASSHVWEARLVKRLRTTGFSGSAGKTYTVLSIGGRRYSAPSDPVTAE